MAEEKTKVPNRYELIDKDGHTDGRRFESAAQLAEWARFLWPEQEQDPERTGKGWDISIVRAER